MPGLITLIKALEASFTQLASHMLFKLYFESSLAGVQLVGESVITVILCTHLITLKSGTETEPPITVFPC